MSGSLEPNTSMYQALATPQAAAPAVNPVAMAQGFQSIQRTALENNQMAQDQTARMAIGQAAQQAYDPVTQQVDNKKLVALISQDPRAAYRAQDVQNAITARELQQQQIDSSQLDMGIKVAENMTGQMGVLATSPNLKRSDVFNLMNNYIAMSPHNDMARSVALNFLSTMPNDDSPASVDALRGRLNQGMLGFKNTADILKMAHPDWIPVQRGNKVDFINPSAISGQPGGPGSLSVNLSPDGARRVVTNVVDPADGRSYPVLAGQIPDAAVDGGAIGGGGGAPGGGTGGAALPGQGAGGANPLGWGQGPANPQGLPTPPGAPANPMAMGGAGGKPLWNPQPAASAPFNPAQALASGQAPSALSKAQEEQATVGTKAFNDNRSQLSLQSSAQSQVVQAMNNEEPLLKMLDAGPGEGRGSQLGLALQAFGNKTGAPGFATLGKSLIANPNDPESFKNATSALQSFNSVMFQNITQQFKSAGLETQDEFKSAMDSYISPTTNKDARAQIFNMAKQKSDELLAENAAAGTYKNSAGGPSGPDWNDFQTKWQDHKRAYGLGTTVMDEGAVHAPVGDTKGLLASVGMHPDSGEPAASPTAPAHPSWVPAGAVYSAAHGAYYNPTGRINPKTGQPIFARVVPPGGQ